MLIRYELKRAGTEMAVVGLLDVVGSSEQLFAMGFRHL